MKMIDDGAERPITIERQTVADTLQAVWQAQDRLGRLLRDDTYSAGYQAGFEDALETVAWGLGVKVGNR